MVVWVERDSHLVVVVSCGAMWLWQAFRCNSVHLSMLALGQLDGYNMAGEGKPDQEESSAQHGGPHCPGTHLLGRRSAPAPGGCPTEEGRPLRTRPPSACGFGSHKLVIEPGTPSLLSGERGHLPVRLLCTPTTPHCQRHGFLFSQPISPDEGTLKGELTLVPSLPCTPLHPTAVYTCALAELQLNSIHGPSR